MRSKVREIRKLRQYSEEFKKSIVDSFERGEFSILQLSKLYGIGNPTIYSWVYKFSAFNEKGCRIVEMKDSQQQKLKELSNKVKELEQIVGQKQIAIDYLEKMIELAKTDLNIDLKKNYNSKPSVGSNAIKKN
jgi:transposase-like protein